ncbi:MAG: DUF554 domain-containing protein [Clostridiales bacterium]|nr:DUF554 domain-containing protein [Eubacteriales bacterium]MDH7565602.1 DUF554 domain-containing protein [Clostridiales bacterium]
MIGLGTIVNAAVVVAGGVAGSFIKNGLPQRFKNIIMQGVGLSVLFIGISGALQGIYKVADGGKLDRQYIMTMIFSLVLGGIIGELLDIENKLEKMGSWIQSRFMKSGGNVAEGFVTASLVFCVGAMAIVGSIEDGLTGNATTLLAKSILDCVTSVVFAASMGIGVALSALTVLIYQGSITLLAGFIKPWLADAVVTQVSLVGSILIMAIGTNLLEFKRIKVGNLLPGVLIPFVYYIITVAIGK